MYKLKGDFHKTGAEIHLSLEQFLFMVHGWYEHYSEVGKNISKDYACAFIKHHVESGKGGRPTFTFVYAVGQESRQLGIEVVPKTGW